MQTPATPDSSEMLRHVRKPIWHDSAAKHVQGVAEYIDDIREPDGTLHVAVGMATRILPHNLVELWEAQIGILHGEQVELEPDFPQGGIADISVLDYADGEFELTDCHRVTKFLDKGLVPGMAICRGKVLRNPAADEA